MSKRNIRPRLVEEGEPISMFENAQQRTGMDHGDFMSSREGSSTSHAFFQQQQQNHNRPLSSYRKPTKINSQLKTHIVIGGEQLASGDDDMDVDMDADEFTGDNDSNEAQSTNFHTDNVTRSPQHNYNQHAQVSFSSTNMGGIQQQYYQNSSSVNRMEGVETGPQLPLVVMDGANIAHAYSQAKAAMYEQQYSRTLTTSSIVAALGSQNGVSDRREPDVEGIKVAVDYFLSGGAQCRVMVVLPSYWLRTKPRSGDNSQDNAKMQTPQLESLHELHAQGLLCCAPSADDDDSYIISIARRADARSTLNGGGGGFILSNDMFRDAVKRDNDAGSLRFGKWLNGESRSKDKLGARISYTFCDIGALNECGDRVLDFIPNPLHCMIRNLDRF